MCAQDKGRGRRTRRKAGVRGRLVGPRVKKETAAPVGGRRRRFSAAAAAAAAEQSPMGLEALSLFEVSSLRLPGVMISLSFGSKCHENF